MAVVAKKTTRWIIWFISAIFGLSLTGYAATKYGVQVDFSPFETPVPTVSATPTPTGSPVAPTTTPTPTPTPKSM